MNLWTRSEKVREIVFSKRLAGIDSELMGTAGVRIYHDQALYKEPGGGHTPWHADQYYWPLASDKTITAWIPLQETPMELGPLEFSAGSFNLKTGRDKAISDESQQLLEDELNGNQEAKGLIRSALKELDRLNDIVSEYLQFARFPKPHLKRGTIDDVIRDAPLPMRGRISPDVEAWTTALLNALGSS